MNFQQLNRKVHTYTALFFLLSFCLFAISGLMLNHRWSIWEYWSKRVETEHPIAVTLPAEGSNLEIARSVLSQIDIAGEIRTLRIDSEAGRLEINTTRPGLKTSVVVDTNTGTGTLTTTELNAWELLPSMHVMAGLHSNIPEKKNWAWTQAWSLIMDLTAIAMLVLAASGLYMWIGLKSERKIGLIVLESGATVFLIVFWFLAKF